jgi:hypothetical protein
LANEPPAGPPERVLSETPAPLVLTVSGAIDRSLAGGPSVALPGARSSFDGR